VHAKNVIFKKKKDLMLRQTRSLGRRKMLRGSPRFFKWKAVNVPWSQFSRASYSVNGAPRNNCQASESLVNKRYKNYLTSN